MNSATFTVYRHSGKFQPAGPSLAILTAVIAGFPAGYAYAYFMRWIPFIYLNILAAVFYGAAFGAAGGWFMKRYMVRNNPVALATGFAMGVIALYLAWNGHMNAIFKDSPLFCPPGEMIERMKVLYEKGTWSMHSGDAPVTGPMLGLVWLVEAGMIIGFTTSICYGKIAHMPFCEDSQCWLDQVKEINTLREFNDPADVATFKAGDLGPLTKAQPKEERASTWARILLKHSPNSKVFHTLRIQNVTLKYDRKGKATLKCRNLTQDLVLPADMLGLISKFEHFNQPAEPPGGAGIKTDATDQAAGDTAQAPDSPGSAEL